MNNKLWIGVLLIGMMSLVTSCGGDTEEGNKPSIFSKIDSTSKNVESDEPEQTLSPKMAEVRALLVGDWEEDTIAFKKEYKMPPPPAQNCKVRWQNDGYVYIPGVLLTKENWDKWELVNDSTIHVKKRQTGAVRVFVIDDIAKDVLNYRMIVSPEFHRKFRLLKMK